MRKLILGIANGEILCDGEPIFSAKDIRVGLFKSEA
jgi:3-hydroxyacyl-[acyl-carrier protein] dehydratase/trans-2-decenoyl-[acyl-carrier protein] isomerase